jgi:alpha-tubulin suppressor-like RCC1 family protein
MNNRNAKIACKLAGLLCLGMLHPAGSEGLWCLPAQAGTVVAWGDTSQGKCNVPAGLNAVAIAAGPYQSLAIRADGTVVGWGAAGYLGLTTIPAGLTNVIGIAVGGSNSVALKADGSVVIWGTNNFGVLPQPSGLSNIVAVASGYRFSLALQSDGSLHSWSLPGVVSLAQTGVVASSQSSIASGTTHSLALRPDGTVVAWGANGSHQCDVPADLTNAVAVIGGSGYSLALRADGTVLAWGDSAPSLPSLTDVVAVAGGGNIGLALKKDGTVVPWGTYNGTPLTVPPGLTNVVAIAVGMSHALALVGDAPPVAKAAASNLNWNTNCLSLSLPTENGRVYRLEYKPSLSASNWTPLAMAPGVGAMQALRDLTASNSARIYRVRRW